MKELVIESIKAVNEELEIEELQQVNENTPLFELLDSMAVLDLVLEIEERLQKKFGRYIQIADERTMDAVSTPFKNLTTLIKHVEEKIDG